MHSGHVDIRHAKVPKGHRIYDWFGAQQILADLLEMGVSRSYRESRSYCQIVWKLGLASGSQNMVELEMHFSIVN